MIAFSLTKQHLLKWCIYIYNVKNSKLEETYVFTVTVNINDNKFEEQKHVGKNTACFLKRSWKFQKL